MSTTNETVWISGVRHGIEDNYKILISNDDWTDETKQQIQFKYKDKQHPSGIWHSKRSQITIIHNNILNGECYSIEQKNNIENINNSNILNTNTNSIISSEGNENRQKK
eukprot:772909_1